MGAFPGIRTQWFAFVPPCPQGAEVPDAPARHAAHGAPTATAYQRKDPLYRQAKREGYRSRAAFKLLEIQRAHGLLAPGQRVVDLGCWPGGWLQVASRIVGPRGRVVGLDLAPLDPPLENANTIALVGDLAAPASGEAVREALGGLGDGVLCDAAPKLTGVRATDRAREASLLEAVEAQLGQLLRHEGWLVVKILDSPEADDVVARLRRRFRRAKTVRLRATRAGSSERYLIGRGLRPPASPSGPL